MYGYLVAAFISLASLLLGRFDVFLAASAIGWLVLGYFDSEVDKKVAEWNPFKQVYEQTVQLADEALKIWDKYTDPTLRYNLGHKEGENTYLLSEYKRLYHDRKTKHKINISAALRSANQEKLRQLTTGSVPIVDGRNDTINVVCAVGGDHSKYLGKLVYVLFLANRKVTVVYVKDDGELVFTPSDGMSLENALASNWPERVMKTKTLPIYFDSRNKYSPPVYFSS